MKHIVWKVYWAWDFEKEEKWINEMSAKGLHLADYSWFRYSFEDGTPDEYIYRLELLENLPNTAENTAYIKFMEDTGVEHIASYFRWVWFRKKATDGSFDLFSDIDSRIKHLNKILCLFKVLCFFGVFCFCTGILNIGVYLKLDRLSSNLTIGIFNTVFGSFLACALFFSSSHLLKKIRALKEERVLHE